MRPFAFLVVGADRLSADPHATGLRVRIDARCLQGEPVPGAFAHVCAAADAQGALRFDEPEVQEARRAALEHWIPLLGDDLVCLTTFALDASRYAGALTVARSPDRFADDPFARLFPGRVIPTGLFCEVPPPPGPVIERYAGAPWPGGRFAG